MNCIPCTKNKAKIQVQNEIFDLMDENGDNKVEQYELQIVAKHVWEADIARAQMYLNQLRSTQPLAHVTKILGTSNVYKRHLKQLYPRVSHNVWVNVVIPELERKEINRLSAKVTNVF